LIYLNNLYYINRLLDLSDLTDGTAVVTLEHSNTGKVGADIEGIGGDGLLRNQHDLSSAVGGELLDVSGPLATSLLRADLHDLSNAHGRVSGTDVAGRGVTNGERSGKSQSLDHSVDALGGDDGLIVLEDHDITLLGHVVLVQVLHVDTDVVTRNGLRHVLVVHFDGEDLTEARVSGGVGRHELDFLTGLEGTLLDTTADDVTDTLDLQVSGHRHTESGIDGTSGDGDHLVEGIVQSVDVDGLVTDLNVNTLPPRHVLGRLEQVVSLPSGNRDDGDLLGDLRLGPTDLSQHTLHLSLDFVESLLGVTSLLLIHLVDADNQLLDAQKLEEKGVLAGLSLDDTLLVVTLGNGGDEVTVSGDHNDGNIGLGGTGDHVLDEILVSGSIDDGVVVLRGVELLSLASNGHTTFTFFLLGIHEESEGERGLAETLSFLTQLLHFTLGNTTEIEDQTTSGGTLSRIDVTADGDRNVLLSFVLRHVVVGLKPRNKRPPCTLR